MKISPTFYGARVHCRIDNNPQPVPIPSQINPHYAAQFIPWRSVLVLSSHLLTDLASCLFPASFPIKTLCAPFLFPMRAQCPAHLIILDLLTRIILPEECRFWNSPLFTLIHYCYFVTFRPKYLPQYPIIKSPQSVFHRQCGRPSFKSVQKNRQSDSFSNLICIFGQKILHQIVTAFPEFNLLVISPRMQFSFVSGFPKYLNLATFLKDLRHTVTLVFSAFTSRLITLLVTSKASVFFFIIVFYRPVN